MMTNNKQGGYKLFRRVFILVLCLIIIYSNLVHAEDGIPEGNTLIEDEFAEFIIEDEETEDNIPISIEELGSPKYLNAEIVDGEVFLNWTNYTSVFLYNSNYKLEYQIDFKVGREKWASENPDKILPSGELEINSYGKSSTSFYPIHEGLYDEITNIENKNYGIRLRYLYTYIDNNEEKIIYGRFSSPINLGLQPYYQFASPWALEELDKAANYGFITEKIRSNMTNNITREEFCELAMKLYYDLSDKIATHLENPFIDVQNPEVLKAAELGIVAGIGDGKFAPNNPVTRQEIAVMIKRVLSLANPSLDNHSYSDVDYLDKNETSSWAINELGFAINNGIIQGNKGRINPLGYSTREQAAIMILRTFEKFKKVGEGFVSE